ncbi:MAG TPA: competence/damage-inducible protein A [bacterium]|nr:competence/damage-inducible protein A [bacterium]HPN42920.1 competence/damage-inducible protein A [bacterium]
MNIEIISIGDELLIGQTINTNAGWMGEQLLNAGMRVQWVSTVGDEYDHLVDALKLAESRADFVLMTGGLGPTHDDITKKVISDYFKAKLILDRRVLKMVQERFKKRGIVMVKANEEQAMVPDIAEIIINKLGTAPGLIFRKGNKNFYVMPGVPFEMQAMMTEKIIPDMLDRYRGAFSVRKTLATTGIPESTLFETMGDMAKIERFARVAFLPDLAGVKIRLTAAGQDHDHARRNLEEAEKLVRSTIEKFIFADDDIKLEEAIARMLAGNRKTLAIAESCTGGLISHQFTNIPGSSLIFMGSVVCYSNAAKMTLLGVPREMLVQFGSVSEQVAGAMAEGARKRFGADYAISTTGIAGPSGGTPDKPVGLVYVGYADEQETVASRHVFFQDRLGNKARFSQAAMNLLRTKLLSREE